MNSVNLIGNLTRDVEVRYVGQNNTAIATLGVAVNSGRKDDPPVFVDVDVWGVVAENCAKYLSKGSKVGVVGRLKQESWEDKESGKKRSKILVVASNVQFLNSKGSAEATDEPASAEEPTVDAGTPEEVPF